MCTQLLSLGVVQAFRSNCLSSVQVYSAQTQASTQHKVKVAQTHWVPEATPTTMELGLV